MITRLEIDGFKSLRDFAIDLGPFTVLVGPNSAGKSNILEALALLSCLASEPIEPAFKHGRGRAIDQFTLEKGEPVRSIRFAAELFLPADVDVQGVATNRLRYELTITRERRASGTEALMVEHERLATIPEERDTWITLHSVQPGRVRHAPETDVFRQVDKRAPRGSQRVLRLLLGGEAGSPRALMPADTGTLPIYLGTWFDEMDAQLAPFSGPARALALALGAFRLVHLDSARPREESERIGGDTLAPDASNLPTVLAALPPAVLGEIRADLVGLVPGISTFEVVAERDSFRIDFELSGGDRLPARLVSDGTLRALALLTALRSDRGPSTIAIEEPENGIYPGRLRTLLDLLREATETPGSALPESHAPSPEEAGEEEPTVAAPPQILLTSHSPVVLAAMRDDPGCLRFIDMVRRNGHLSTRARPVGTPAAGERGTMVPLREVDSLLSLATTEAAE